MIQNFVLMNSQGAEVLRFVADSTQMAISVTAPNNNWIPIGEADTIRGVFQEAITWLINNAPSS